MTVTCDCKLEVIVKIKMINRVLCLLIMLSMLTGCLGLGSKDEDDSLHYYVIDVDRGAVASHFAKNKVLYIKPVRLTSHFRGKNIIFRVGNDEYQAQSFHEFFSEPDDMFTDQLKRWLQKSGLFSHVTLTDDGNADLVLETAVTSLYGEQRDQFSPQSVLEMQFFLSSHKEGNNQTLFQTGLRIEIDIDETTPTNVVKGWNSGLEELLSTVEDDFSGYFSKLSP